MTEYEGFVCAPGDVGKIAIVVSRFNKSITDKLLEGALAKLRENMVSEEQITVVRVPGAFELPTLAQRFAVDEEYAAIICLGCVIKGETPHDEYINRAVSSELARIGAEYCLPVIFGVLTCNTVDQARARSGQAEVGKDKTLGEQPGNKGAEAAEAALEMLDLFGKLPELPYDVEENEREFDSLGRNSERYLRGDFETVDVDPDSLEEIDDDDDDDKEWFVHGSSFDRKKDARRPNNNRESEDGRPKKRHDGSNGKGGFSSKPKSNKSGDRFHGDKKFKKDGDKKRHK